MYEAFARRQAISEIMDRKNAMIAGVWANPNFDQEGKADLRGNFISKIDNIFEEAIDRIHGVIPEVDLESDPFLAAMKMPDVPETIGEIDGINESEFDWPVETEEVS